MFFDVSDKVDLITCKIEWKIYDLNLRNEFLGSEQVLISKKFYDPKCPLIVWQLRVYPKVISIASYGSQNITTYVSLTQIGLQETKFSLYAKYSIYAHNIEGKRVNICSSCSRNFENKTESEKSQIYLQNISHADGSVLLYCEVEFVPHNIKCVNYKNQIVNNQINERNLLKNLFLDKTLSDFVIKIRNEKINVHRCILAQNSSVFFNNGELEIVDSSPECFKAMIEYFYLGKINSSNILENNVDDIYALAHKYCVDSLMNKCEIIMASNIDQKNFVRRCSYSQLYGLKSITKACIKFIAANRKNFLDSNEWKEFKTKNKDFAVQLMEMALKFEL
uniref:BTB domain-containing protein n=1 Tax=Meloidogyne enterolobii TaxID=390850 RepID=A0A6V7WB25_MELEN|nr:unnamed protein product [Meloidogyne enterolobii]